MRKVLIINVHKTISIVDKYINRKRISSFEESCWEGEKFEGKFKKRNGKLVQN